MKKVLHDPIAPTQRKSDSKPWTFKNSAYDNRTSCSVTAGDNYGIGFKAPIGKESASGLKDGPIPFGCSKFSVDEIFGREDKKG